MSVSSSSSSQNATTTQATSSFQFTDEEEKGLLKDVSAVVDRTPRNSLSEKQLVDIIIAIRLLIERYSWVLASVVCCFVCTLCLSEIFVLSMCGFRAPLCVVVKWRRFSNNSQMCFVQIASFSVDFECLFALCTIELALLVRSDLDEAENLLGAFEQIVSSREKSLLSIACELFWSMILKIQVISCI
jgi:hypothetical protein